MIALLIVPDYDLYGGTPPHEDPDTSRDAAESIRGSAASLREQVLRFITRCGDLGATDEEIQFALDMGGNTERPRRRELEELGLVIRAGRTRLTSAHRRADVWISAPDPPPPVPTPLGPFVQPPLFGAGGAGL